MIVFENVSFSYKNEHGASGDVGLLSTTVFENLNLTIPDTGITAVIAPSGVGKTTLLRLVAGLEVPEHGEIKGGVGEGVRVSYVFQEQRLLPWYTAFKNIKVATKRTDGEISAFLNEFGITSELSKKRPSELSGGQRQRICLARALLFESDILLLDEPFTGLDTDNRLIALKKIKEYALTKPVVLVSHISEDVAVADKVIEIK